MARLIAEVGDRVRIDVEDESGTLKGHLGKVVSAYANGAYDVLLDGDGNEADLTIWIRYGVPPLISTKEFTTLRKAHRLESA